MADLNILDRDRTGVCTEGECRDRVFEGEKERQFEMAKFEVEVPDYYPSAKWAYSRNLPPDQGHV